MGMTFADHRFATRPRDRKRHSHAAWCLRAATLAAVLLAYTGAASAQQQFTITFKGTLLNSFTGPCTTSTYDMKCPSGACFCQLYFIDTDTKNNKATGGFIGKSTDGHIDFSLQGDGDFVGTGGFGQCRPFFASAFINGDDDDEQLDFNGTFCDPLKTKNPTDTIVGGYGIISSTHGHQGFGTVDGDVDEDSGQIQLKFKGPAS